MSLFQQMIQDSPALLYTMQDVSGSTVRDDSGNGRHGTNNGPGNVGILAAGPTPGVKAYDFDGSDGDYVTTPYTTNLTSGFTLEALIYPVSHTDDKGVIITKSSYYAASTTDFPLFLEVTQGGSPVVRLTLDSGNDFSNDITLSSPITLNTWHFVSGVYRPSGVCSLWLDGALVASTTIGFTIATTANNWIVGTASDNGGGAGLSRFKGRMAYAAIYSSALSDARVTSHHRAALRLGVSY